jgi:hypothetical protein
MAFESCVVQMTKQRDYNALSPADASGEGGNEEENSFTSGGHSGMMLPTVFNAVHQISVSSRSRKPSFPKQPENANNNKQQRKGIDKRS